MPVAAVAVALALLDRSALRVWRVVTTLFDRTDRAYWTAIGVGLANLILLGPLGRRIALIAEDDLSRIWAGPRAALAGADPYDPATWVATATVLGTQVPDTAVYIYPPWVLVALLPLGAMPLPAASILWSLGGLALAIVGVRALLREFLPGVVWAHALVPLTLLLSWAGILGFVIGQWAYLLIAALSAAVLALRRGRAVPAGLAALALIAKPQLFVVAVPALGVHALWPRADAAATRAARLAVATAAGSGLALVVVGWLAFPQWWPTWFREIGGQQLQPDFATVASLLFALFGSGADRFAPLVLLGLAALALRFHPLSDAWLAVWLALTIAGAPYTNSYDQIILIVPIVIAAGILRPRSRRASTIVLVGGSLLLLVGTPFLYGIALRRVTETYSVLVPLAAYALIVVALWPLGTWPRRRSR
ncbi:MAG TPA: glycosyltransferase 87 family protein [Candidatus Limnocylindrales bacterium]|nr:glycosyltransferase 87 family protein [Candidatus Limnocylindrales bacterium]